MISEIVSLADKYYPSVLRLRRHLHRYPELSFEEKETARFLRGRLKPLGLKISKNIGGTGFTALLSGGRGGKVAAFRADMDALSVTEETGLPYKSKHEGKMHACGHDVHMSIAVGVASILSEIKSALKGDVKFIFQPAEENPPGGAISMIEGGALKSPDVDAIFALHVDPTIPVGKLGIRDGVMMATVVDFDVQIKGTGGHAARPDRSVDAIVVAANVVGQLQSIVSRNIDPVEPVVITFGTISGGSARNAISDRVLLEGTMRSLSKKTMARMQRLLERTCKYVTKASGASYKISYLASYPHLANDMAINACIRRASQDILGKRKVLEIDAPIMGAEDFAQYLEHVPGAMFMLGVGNEKIGAVYPWHHGRFKVDEEAMKIGMAVCAKALYDFLEG